MAECGADEGMRIGKETELPAETCSSTTLSITNPTWLHLGFNSDRRGEKPATNRLFYATSRASDYLQAGRPRGGISSPGRIKNLLSSTSSKSALGCTQLPIQWLPGPLPRGWSGWGLKSTTHLQLVPRSRKCGSVHPFSHTPSRLSV
jgi:hypothetical protein